LENLAPIVLFVYNRPWHTLQTLEALAANELADQSTLYIFCDGPKENANTEDLNKIEEVRKVIKQKKWCHEVHFIERQTNKGLANSVIDGVTEIVNQYGRIIVLEDDLVTAKGFLKFMNEALEVYEKSCHVFSVTGFTFPLNTKEVCCFLSPLATSSWGWATWSAKWKAFDKEISLKSQIQEHHEMRLRFNFGFSDYASMLDNSNSWAIRWYYSVFIRNGLGIFPSKSLVKNIGFDGSGVHYNKPVDVKADLLTTQYIPIEYTQILNMDLVSQQLAYFKKDSLNISKKSFYKKILLKIINRMP